MPRGFATCYGVDSHPYYLGNILSLGGDLPSIIEKGEVTLEPYLQGVQGVDGTSTECEGSENSERL